MREAGKRTRKDKFLNATIRYFPDEGRHHRAATLRACRARLRGGDIRHFVIFTLDGKAGLEASKVLGKLPVKIIAISFPPENVTSRDVPAGTFQIGILGDIATRLQKAGITIVQGTMPLREILIPGDKDVKIEAIRRTLGLMSGGLDLCVEAVLMACDAGHVDIGEIVLACSADTAIVARASRTTALLVSFEIQEVLCKPRLLTTTKKALYPTPKKPQ
jgi:hypothetical protein